MTKVNNEHLMIKVCELYYEDGLSQKEIASKLGISRPQICRIISLARERNIVEIKINNPYADETALEKKIFNKFGLQDALVVNTDGDAPGVIFDSFGKRASTQLSTYIPDNSIVGVMSGKTVQSLIDNLSNFERHGLKIVPLIGGHSSEGAGWYANAIAQRFAQSAKSSKYYILNAPVIMNSEQARNMLIKEPSIKNVLEIGEKCAVAIVGIGRVDVMSTTVLASAAGKRELEVLKKSGAFASVCTTYLNKNGEIVETEFSKKMVGQSLGKLKESKIIAVAIGRDKVDAIKAALRSGFIDIFVTDIDTAEKIV